MPNLIAEALSTRESSRLVELSLSTDPDVRRAVYENIATPSEVYERAIVEATHEELCVIAKKNLTDSNFELFVHSNSLDANVQLSLVANMYFPAYMLARLVPKLGIWAQMSLLEREDLPGSCLVTLLQSDTLDVSMETLKHPKFSMLYLFTSFQPQQQTFETFVNLAAWVARATPVFEVKRDEIFQILNLCLKRADVALISWNLLNSLKLCGKDKDYNLLVTTNDSLLITQALDIK